MYCHIVCRTDNIDLIHKSGAGVTLTSTAMKSLEDRSVYFGKTAQWGTLHKQSCIDKIACFQDEEVMIDQILNLVRKGLEQEIREHKITHKFCFAVNTGACGGKRNTQANARSAWHKDDFCPDWMLSPPI